MGGRGGGSKMGGGGGGKLHPDIDKLTPIERQILDHNLKVAENTSERLGEMAIYRQIDDMRNQQAWSERQARDAEARGDTVQAAKHRQDALFNKVYAEILEDTYG